MSYGLKTKGGNKTKNPHANDKFQEVKKLGRSKQVWIWERKPRPQDGVSCSDPGVGHWEKVTK